jgi:cleavage and polyadenylation specificity factor subunit 1
MQALRSELLPPSGVQFAASLKLLPYTVNRRRRQYVETSDHEVVCNLVVARSNFIRIYEIVEEVLPIGLTHVKGASSRAGKESEAVEGEVEMDTQGEGFVNLGTVKVSICFAT